MTIRDGSATSTWARRCGDNRYLTTGTCAPARLARPAAEPSPSPDSADPHPTLLSSRPPHHALGGGAGLGDHGWLPCAARRIVVSGLLGAVIAEGRLVRGGRIPCAGAFACWSRMIFVRVAESFRMAEPCPRDSTENDPSRGNCPPCTRKRSEITILGMITDRKAAADTTEESQRAGPALWLRSPRSLVAEDCRVPEGCRAGRGELPCGPGRFF